MAVRTFDSEFWIWFFKENFPENFSSLRPDQRVISNTKNVFVEERRFDLFINMEDGVCYDESNSKRTIPEYVAIRTEQKITDTEKDLEIEFEKWRGDQKARFERMQFTRDYENYRWTKKTGGSSQVEVTNFDIILTSIIEKFDIKTQEWQRYYEGDLRYLYLDRPVLKEFKFTPAQTHSYTEFSKAVWDKDFLRVNNMKNDEVRSFWSHVAMFWEPRIVREFNHYGFIEFEDRKYFLAENVLIKFPDSPGKKLELISEENGAFPVGNNKYVKPPDVAIHLPQFELGVPDQKSGLYIKKMNMLLDEQTFKREIKQVEKHFCKMIAGEDEFGQWGKLILGYVFSYFFFEDIYDHFKHVIFLYLYGQGNVGKGEIAKRILDFFGIKYLDSLNTPPARSVDEALEQKSQIPAWIDEHVPEGPGNDAKIKDQEWNSWFELKMRRTNIRKGDSWGVERKEVRTMPLFCSNFKPRTDHLSSRTLILEYKFSQRGPEEHVKWLIQRKELLQLLTLSFMQNYNLINRKTFVWDTERIRSSLKTDVKKILAEKEVNIILQDRQISQFAILLTVYHWIDAGYRRVIEDLAAQSQNLEAETNTTNAQIKRNSLEENFHEILDEKLYNFVRDEIVRTAIVAAQHDPLTDYIESIGALIQIKEITTGHFNWTEDGHLKIWSKAVWDEYERRKRGTDDMVRKDLVEERLMELSRLTDDGDKLTINWTHPITNKKITCKGFYIEDAWKNELFALNFQYHEYATGVIKKEHEGDKETETEQPFKPDDDLPF